MDGLSRILSGRFRSYLFIVAGMDVFACSSILSPAVVFPAPLQAVNIRRHLEKNRKDTDSKFRLILVESRIHRLARYYKVKKALPAVWKYESATASALVA